ncbi:hypothetical protein [Segetibacter koreensis]|uniref:hypothetical protein n=1 Tax=Segetibacter koreensis TaxID=398037 RepID=UPI0003820836|nr:hypothetical protein [Segetibacter koreensis]
MKKFKRGVLIFSGFNQRAIISFCRICDLNNININIIASNETDCILKTVYKSKVIYIRKSKTFSLEEFQVFKELVLSEETLIIPSTEYLNRFLINYRSDIEDLGFIVPLCKKELYEEVSNKYSFGKLCNQNNIKTPIELTLSNKFSVPFVAKPKSYTAKSGSIHKPSLVYNSNVFYKNRDKFDSDDFYFQEFIGGNSYYLLFYFPRKGDVSTYSQENLIQQSNGRSIIAAKSSDIHENKIAGDFIELFVKRGFTGLVMVEVKFSNDQFYMIEANPRLWGPSQLILDAQMDLFHKFLYDYGLIENNFKFEYRPNIKYFWSGGIIEDQVQKNKIAFHNYSKKEFFDEYYSLIANDIYARPDTFEIFEHEKEISKNGK